MASTPRGYESFSTFSPQQSQIFDQLMETLQNRLGEGADERFAAPFERKFREETIPGLAERFSGLGAQRSSGFAQALGSAGAGLSEQLASLGAQREENTLSQLMNLLNLDTQGLVKKDKPWWQEGLIGLGGGLGQGIGSSLVGGGMGGAMGSILSLLKSLFSGKSQTSEEE